MRSRITSARGAPKRNCQQEKPSRRPQGLWTAVDGPHLVTVSGQATAGGRALDHAEESKQERLTKVQHLLHRAAVVAGTRRSVHSWLAVNLLSKVRKRCRARRFTLDFPPQIRRAHLGTSSSSSGIGKLAHEIKGLSSRRRYRIAAGVGVAGSAPARLDPYRRSGQTAAPLAALSGVLFSPRLNALGQDAEAPVIVRHTIRDCFHGGFKILVGRINEQPLSQNVVRL